MNIDGNDIRPDSIDAVTEIEISVDASHEGTDKIVRGCFDVFVRGLRIKVYRAKKCADDKPSREKAVEAVRAMLTPLRVQATTALIEHEPSK